MDDEQNLAGRETLREALQKLEKARKEERRLRLEAQLQGELLGVLEMHHDAPGLFAGMIEVLHKALDFDRACALDLHPDGHFVAVQDTDGAFANTRWQPGKLFERVLQGHVPACFDVRHVPEWASAFDGALAAGICSALHFMLKTSKRTVIVVLTHPKKGAFTRDHSRLLKRMTPLATQALIKIEARKREHQNRQLQAENAEAQRALALLEQTTRVLGIGNMIWRAGKPLAHISDTLQKLAAPWGGMDAWWSAVQDTGGLALAQALASGQAFEAIVVRLQTPAGHPQVLRLSGTHPPDKHGLLLLVTDITQWSMAVEGVKLSEARHNETSSRLASLLQNLHAGVVVEDEDRRMVLANEALCKMFAIPAPPEALVGTDCAKAAEQSSALFEDPKGFIEDIHGILTAKTLVTGQELQMLDGRILERDYIPIFTDEVYKGHLWQYRDVTDKRRAVRALQHSEGLKSAVMETSIDGLITIDSKGDVVEWNPAAEQIFGHTRQEALGQPMEDLIIPHSMRDGHRHGLHHRVTTGEGNILGQRLELTAVRKTGEEFPCEVSITSFEVAGEMMFAGHVRDITAQKRAQEALRKAKEDAEAASQAKSRFLAVMSHEMRTPLNAILGMTELVLGTPLSDEQTDYLQTAMTSAEALLHLINEVLDLSKIEEEQLEIEEIRFDLHQVIERVTRLLEVKAKEKGIRLRSFVDTNLPRRLMGDPQRIRQVLVNLIGNAIKFTQKGEVRVMVDVDLDEETGANVSIRVEDTGIGIPPERLMRVFERFYQGDASTRRVFGGTGLGLSISKHLVEMMGGQISVTSTLGVGSAFTVTMPLAMPIGPSTRTLGRSSSELRPVARESLVRHKRHLLLVEDNMANRLLARRFLEGAGYTLDEAEDGSIAVAMASTRRYDAILMDLQMPRMDGFDATAQIRIDEAEMGRKPVPIIAVTAHAIEGFRERCLAAGMNDYLTKPIRRASLLEAVDKWLFPLPAVVIADDAAPMRKLMERYLSRDPICTPHFAVDGGQAMEMVQRLKPSVVVLDIEMPVMTGLEVAASLRNMPEFANLPILALTGHTDPHARRLCLDVGCDEVLTKPVNAESITTALKRHLKTSQASPTESAPTSPSPKTSTQGPLPPTRPPSRKQTLPPIYIEVDPDIMDLVPGYLQSCRKTMTTVHNMMHNKDLEALRITGHNFKGTASPYGFTVLGELGAKMEKAAVYGDLHDLEAIIAEINGYLERVVIRD